MQRARAQLLPPICPIIHVSPMCQFLCIDQQVFLVLYKRSSTPSIALRPVQVWPGFSRHVQSLHAACAASRRRLLGVRYARALPVQRPYAELGNSARFVAWFLRMACGSEGEGICVLRYAVISGVRATPQSAVKGL